MNIEFVNTNLGEKIIKDLKKSGWIIIDKYPMVFDKGIDNDFYILKRENIILRFEWTNWFEWEISGPDESISELSNKYKIVKN